MALVDEVLYEFLASRPLLAGVVAQRIYPFAAPQDTKYPFLVFERQAVEPVHHYYGSSDLVFEDFEFTALATTYLSARLVMDALRREIDGLLDFEGSSGSLRLRAVLRRDESYGLTPANEGSQDHTYVGRATYRLSYRQALPVVP